MERIADGELVTTKYLVESHHLVNGIRGVFKTGMVGIVISSTSSVLHHGDSYFVLGYVYVVDYPEMWYNGKSNVLKIRRVNLTSDQIVRAKVSSVE